MIKQTYIVNREVYEVIIDGKEVFYKDRKMQKPLRIIPMDNKIKKDILMSRNKIDSQIVKQFELTKEEQVEYDEAIEEGKDIEERLANLCKKDCLKSSSILQKEEITDGPWFSIKLPYPPPNYSFSRMDFVLSV